MCSIRARQEKRLRAAHHHQAAREAYRAYGRSGETYHDEDDFRKVVVFVADKPIIKPKPVPVPLSGRYEGPVEPGMVFDYETGKKHAYERLTITKRQGDNIWARGRGGESFHYENEFRRPAERRCGSR